MSIKIAPVGMRLSRPELERRAKEIVQNAGANSVERFNQVVLGELDFCHFAERNGYFRDNPKRAGKKIWEIDFFQDMESLRLGLETIPCAPTR